MEAAWSVLKFLNNPLIYPFKSVQSFVCLYCFMIIYNIISPAITK